MVPFVRRRFPERLSRNTAAQSQRSRRFRAALEGLEERLVLSLGAELPLSSLKTAVHQVASASSSNGSAVAVYSQDFFGGQVVMAQRLSRSGLSVNKVGAPIVVAGGQVSSVSVAMDSKGDFEVVWSQTVAGKPTQY
jgi:hypothetical protein